MVSQSEGIGGIVQLKLTTKVTSASIPASLKISIILNTHAPVGSPSPKFSTYV